MTEEEHQKMQQIQAQNDKFTKKLHKMSKKMQQLADSSKHQVHAFERELAKKAEKESLLESQQKFFDKMAKIENETGDSLSKLVEEELRKISDQIEINSKLVDKRFQKVSQDMDMEKVWKQLEKKVNKEEVY